MFSSKVTLIAAVVSAHSEDSNEDNYKLTYYLELDLSDFNCYPKAQDPLQQACCVYVQKAKEIDGHIPRELSQTLSDARKLVDL